MMKCGAMSAAIPAVRSFKGMVEVLDETFLQKAFGESTGHLYEYSFDNAAVLAGAPPFIFQYLGSDPAAYVPNLFKPKTLETDPQGDVFDR